MDTLLWNMTWHCDVIKWTPDIFPWWPLSWNRNKYPCFYIFPLEFGGVGDLHTHQTAIIHQLKRPCVPDCAYTESMFINSIHISLYDVSLMQKIFISNQKRRGCMKETRMLPAQAANLVANSGNTIYGVNVIAHPGCSTAPDPSAPAVLTHYQWMTT